MPRHLQQLFLKSSGNDYWLLHEPTVTDAPRGFVAETYFVTASEGRYFLKQVPRRPFTASFPDSVRALTWLCQQGCKWLAMPVSTAQGRLILEDNEYFYALFSRVDGIPVASDRVVGEYRHLVYRQLAEVHAIEVPYWVTVKEDFSIMSSQRFLQDLTRLKDRTDQISKAAWTALLPHCDELRDDAVQFAELAEACRKDCVENNLPFIFTHGDFLGNTVQTKQGLPVIVDWDGILVAPLERDLWFEYWRADGDRSYDLYPQIRKPHQAALRFYLLKRYFEDLSDCLYEILSDAIGQSRRELAYQILVDSCLHHWLRPLVRRTSSL